MDRRNKKEELNGILVIIILSAIVFTIVTLTTYVVN